MKSIFNNNKKTIANMKSDRIILNEVPRSKIVQVMGMVGLGRNNILMAVSILLFSKNLSTCNSSLYSTSVLKKFVTTIGNRFRTNGLSMLIGLYRRH